MNCDEEKPYFTPNEGQNGFKCYQKNCDQGIDIVRCTGEFTHDYPFTGTTIAAEVAWDFMKTHPRKSA